MNRRQRLLLVGVVLAIFGALTGGLTHLDSGEDRLGWTLVGGAGIASIVLASRLRRIRGEEPAARIGSRRQ